MASRYDDVLAAIFRGRKLTKDMITGNPSDRRVEFPLTDEPNQAEIDAEAARWLRESAEIRRQEQKRNGGA